ncbi:MFS transporter [Streptomyces californicus]|uniref:MFS transporter n=1 Tax=Streptomyces californicus TaxID=67351 RepID=UPI003822D2F1
MAASHTVRTRSEIWKGFPSIARREIGTVATSTFQSQSTSALMLLLLSVLVIEVTGSAASAPLVIAAGALPALLLVRWVRSVNRLLDHRWVMILSDTGAFAVALALFLLSQADVQAWQIYCGVALFSGFGAFYLPAMRGWVADQSGDITQLTWLNSMLAVATQASVVVGWALGGVLASTVGIRFALGLCAIAYACGIVLQFIVFVVVNRTPLRRAAASAAGPGEQRRSSVRKVPETAMRQEGGAWRMVFSPRRLGLFTGSLLAMELSHVLAFSMFVPLVTQASADRSWVAGLANACFALAAIGSGVLVSGGSLGNWVRSHTPGVLIAGFAVQTVFGLTASQTVLAVALYTLVGVLSGGDTVLQSEVQDRWRSVGSSQAFAVFGAVSGPSQLVGSLVIAFLLLHFSITAVYVGTIMILGFGSALLLVVARAKSINPVEEVIP